MRIFPTPAHSDRQELLDSPGAFSSLELEGTLRDIRRANIFGLGTWVIKHHLDRLLSAQPVDRPIWLLDLGTGSADIPEELCRWAMRSRRDLHIVATDLSEEILDVARLRIFKAGFGDRVTFAACDATAVPFTDGSFDVTICSLAFHHMEPAKAKIAMKEIARVSRIGFVVNDIYRARGAWLTARLLAQLTTNNRLTRLDGPTSVLRAYTPAELQKIARSAGVPLRVYTHPFWRMAAVGLRRTSAR